MAALIACFLITGFMSLVLARSLFEYRMANRSIQWEQALGVAEGGAEICVSRIARSAATGGYMPGAGGGTINGHTYTYRFVHDRIESVGTVGDVSRTVNLYGLAQGYWCKYAYFANYFNSPNNDGTPGSPIWLISGDSIFGPVHCNDDIFIAGSPAFYGEVSLVGDLVEKQGYVNDPLYAYGNPQQVEHIDLQQIDFAQLRANALAQGLVVAGDTTIAVDGDELTVVNAGATNRYTIGENENNIVYVENGLAADPGAGSWIATQVVDSVQVWVPSSVVTQSTAGSWSAPMPVANTGWQPANGYYKQGYYDYQYDRWQYRGWQYGNWIVVYVRHYGYYWVYDFDYVEVDEVVSTDERFEAHYEYRAEPFNNWGWDVAYIEPHDYRVWQPGSNYVVFVNSNLVEIVTNYTDYVWVPSTNANTQVIGNVNIEGQMSKGLTIVAENDIEITGDLTYMDEQGTGIPYTDPASDVMCALISGSDIIVANPHPSAAGNRAIHASIMATGNLTGASEGDPYSLDGRFYVESYNSGAHKGILHVYGGIIQNWRGAVGTFSGGSPRTGFSKDYRYDVRYGPQHGKAPPACPLLNASFNFSRWEEN